VLPGMLIAFIVLCYSRILFLLAVMGYFAGTGFTGLLSGSFAQAFHDMNHFNYILIAMALGGIYDHLGGGFHRYSVDAEWRVPHFEKMLYDQAQLVLAYLEAAQVTGEPFFADVATDTLEYIRRDLTDAGGGFYSFCARALAREFRERLNSLFRISRGRYLAHFAQAIRCGARRAH